MGLTTTEKYLNTKLQPQIGHSTNCAWLNFKYIHSQNTASAPSHPIQHPTAGESTHFTPMGHDMAGCWHINSILANIGRRNSIRILNQYSFWRNILIWAQFICFIKLFVFQKLKLL